MNLFYFEKVWLPILPIVFLLISIIFFIFWAKKIKSKSNFEKIFDKIYVGHSRNESFERLNIDQNLKQALEKYFYNGEKSQKQNIFNLWKKYLK